MDVLVLSIIILILLVTLIIVKVKYDELLGYFSTLSAHVKEIEYEQKFTSKDINAIMKHFNIDDSYDNLKEDE